MAFPLLLADRPGRPHFWPQDIPLFLDFIFCVFGSYSFTSAAVMMAVQTLFAGLTVAAIMYVARQLFGTPTAYWPEYSGRSLPADLVAGCFLGNVSVHLCS